ncbi:MFS transporter [Paenibacillus sp. TAB 01]|uniref:MFS transporter n=1 Tax=Paenibacillus sp. TAB 01 TaxID=3368988 RepID=UPI0037518C65
MTYFLLFYMVFYMGNAVYGTYLPVYFQSIGASATQIGTLLSLGPLVAVLAQPLWGSVGDRAKTKNTVLALLIAGCCVIILFFPLSTAFAYLLFMVCLFTFFQTSISAISDAITLEELEKHKKWSFGADPAWRDGRLRHHVAGVRLHSRSQYRIYVSCLCPDHVWGAAAADPVPAYFGLPVGGK